MSKLVKDETWVYVIVQDPGGQEHFLGQLDEQTGIQFIPIFLDKENALMGLGRFKRQKGLKYEVQAVMYDDLAGDSSAQGFMIFILDGEGQILEKLNP